MKRFTRFIVIVGLFFLVCSCEKFESQIKGKVSYIASDNTEYLVSGAVLRKYKITDDKETLISSVLSDSNGLYVFDYVTAGDWTIKAQLTVEDTVYEGFYANIHTNGENVKEVNIVLDSVRIVTNEE